MGIHGPALVRGVDRGRPLARTLGASHQAGGRDGILPIDRGQTCRTLRNPVCFAIAMTESDRMRGGPASRRHGYESDRRTEYPSTSSSVIITSH